MATNGTDLLWRSDLEFHNFECLSFLTFQRTSNLCWKLFSEALSVEREILHVSTLHLYQQMFAILKTDLLL